MSVTPGARFPFIGTFVVLAPWPFVRAAYARLRGEPFLSLELHAVDLLGPEDGIPPELARAQPDLEVAAVDQARATPGGPGVARTGLPARPAPGGRPVAGPGRLRCSHGREIRAAVVS